MKGSAKQSFIFSLTWLPAGFHRSALAARVLAVDMEGGAGYPRLLLKITVCGVVTAAKTQPVLGSLVPKHQCLGNWGAGGLLLSFLALDGPTLG